MGLQPGQKVPLIAQGAPVDLVFQSIAGTQAANTSFGIDLALQPAADHAAAQAVGRAQRNGAHHAVAQAPRQVAARLEQVLGLPGEPRVDKDVAWINVPRS